MGQAKRRGTFEQRKEQAIAEGRDKSKKSPVTRSLAKLREEMRIRKILRDSQK